MGPRTRAYHQMAIAVLAIATAALGIALWAQDFDLTRPQSENRWIATLYWTQVASISVAILLYFATFASVARMLWQERNVTGRDLVRRPVVWLYFQMAALALLFLAGFLSDLIAAQGSGKPLPM